jgi:hypothetical protein
MGQELNVLRGVGKSRLLVMFLPFENPVASA